MPDTTLPPLHRSDDPPYQGGVPPLDLRVDSKGVAFLTITIESDQVAGQVTMNLQPDELRELGGAFFRAAGAAEVYREGGRAI